MPIVAHQLQSAHLDDLLTHESEYPPDYRFGRERLARKLRDLDDSGCSLSWIIYDSNVSVAYIVVYPQFTRLDRKDKERVIYVDDVFVKRGYEICLFRLIQLFTKQAVELGLQAFPIEGVCRVGAYRAFAGHDTLLRKLGWELSKKSEYWDDALGEEMCWLRWEPLTEQGAKNSAKDSISVSREADETVAPEAKLVTFSQSARYAYRPSVLPEGYVLPGEEEKDEFSALTEAMLGSGDDDLVEIVPLPPVNTQDRLGILEFFGLAPTRGRKRILVGLSKIPEAELGV